MCESLGLLLCLLGPAVHVVRRAAWPKTLDDITVFWILLQPQLCSSHSCLWTSFWTELLAPRASFASSSIPWHCRTVWEEKVKPVWPPSLHSALPFSRRCGGGPCLSFLDLFFLFFYCFFPLLFELLVFLFFNARAASRRRFSAASALFSSCAASLARRCFSFASLSAWLLASVSASFCACSCAHCDLELTVESGTAHCNVKLAKMTARRRRRRRTRRRGQLL